MDLMLELNADISLDGSHAHLTSPLAPIFSSPNFTLKTPPIAFFPVFGETINVISQLIVKARSSIPRGLDHAAQLADVGFGHFRGGSSIPSGLDHTAQGWPDSQRAYPGFLPFGSTTLKGLNLKS
jgi:hypothetical protein